ncbi:MAG: HypC/HybG/HupF family hydrogenase formation chaperone [Pseudomonadota bacterium]
MCLAIPAEVVEIQEGGMLRARVGQSETYLHVSGLLLPEAAELGDFIIVHAGFALRKLDAAEAQETLRLLREVATMADGKPAQF